MLLITVGFQWDFHRMIKYYFHQKVNVRKKFMKESPAKGILPKVYKEYLKLKNKISNPVKNGPKA